MKFAGIAVLFVALLLASQSEARKSYNGYKTYKIIPRNPTQMGLLKTLKEDSRYDFWAAPRLLNKETVVMVPPGNQILFEKMMKVNGFEYSVLIKNVGSVVKRDVRHITSSRYLGKISFDQFYRYDDIVAYVNQLASDYSNLATASVIGKTYEERDIVALTISSGGNGTRPVIFIEAGIHAREWIAPSVALYILNQLVENYESNKELVDNVDWLIVPVTNPDGYEYTHTDDRFWRKNRYHNGPLCKGVDCNRNFGYHYGESGASTWPCDETYRGTEAFSEAESSAIRDFAIPQKGRIQLYFALHSYGPYFLYPYGYDEVLPDDWQDLDDLAKSVTQAINSVSGTVYEVGNSAILLYAAAGGSDDWFKAENGAKYAYTVELPGGGSGGFDPPPSSIVPIVTETWEGIKVAGNLIASKFGKPKNV